MVGIAPKPDRNRNVDCETVVGAGVGGSVVVGRAGGGEVLRYSVRFAARKAARSRVSLSCVVVSRAGDGEVRRYNVRFPASSLLAHVVGHR